MRMETEFRAARLAQCVSPHICFSQHKEQIANAPARVRGSNSKYRPVASSKSQVVYVVTE